MTRSAALALACLLAAPGPALGAALVVEGEGGPLATLPLGADGRWCLIWNHSVTGIEVADCFRTADGATVLETSRQPDYAAGLGESPGARIRRDGDAYLLDGLDRPVPAAGLTLRRAGPAVAQRIRIGSVETPLPPGRRGERLVIRTAPQEPSQRAAHGALTKHFRNFPEQ